MDIFRPEIVVDIFCGNALLCNLTNQLLQMGGFYEICAESHSEVFGRTEEGLTVNPSGYVFPNATGSIRIRELYGD